jgi:hypothetical protein
MPSSQAEISALFAKIAAQLKSQPWFKSAAWQVSHHPFPAKSPEAITLHVFKKHWHNSDTRGIHVETFLYLDPKKRKKSSVHLHLFHDDAIPGSKLKRKALSQPVVDAIYKEVSAWPGYKFRAGKYGLQPFTKELNGASPGFSEELLQELERICLYCGPEIDRALKILEP